MTQLPSARDSLLARNTDTTRLRLSGDIVSAKQYIGVAQTYMGWLRNTLALGGINHGARHLRLANGVVIKMLWDGVLNIIDIFVPPGVVGRAPRLLCNLYAESGLVDLVGFGGGSAVGFQPGELIFGDAIKEYLDATTEPVIGRIKFDESAQQIEYLGLAEGDSLAFGCPPAVRVDSLISPLTGDVIETSEPSMCLNVQHKKETAAFISPSYFSGKMRLYVQSLYGAGVVSLDKENLFNNKFALRIGNTLCDWTMDHSTGIYTGANYDYWMVELTGSAARVRPLKLSRCGNVLRQWLIQHTEELSDADIRRYESFLLATAQPGGVDWATIATLNAKSLYGEPFTYGWRFNWNGSKASVVCHRAKPDVPASQARWLATLATLELAFDPEAEGFDSVDPATWPLAWSAQLTVEEDSVEWLTRANKDLIWFKDEALGLYTTFIPYRLTTPTFFDHDAPMVCWYDAEDNLTTARFFYEKLTTARTVGVPSQSANVAISCGSLGGAACHLTVNANAVYSGFYISSAPVDDRNYTGNTGTLLISSVRSEGLTGQDSDWVLYGLHVSVVGDETCNPMPSYPPNICPGSDPWNVRAWGIRDYHTMTGERWSQINGTRSYESILLIPERDCEAAYYGGWLYVDANTTYNRYTRFNHPADSLTAPACFVLDDAGISEYSIAAAAPTHIDIGLNRGGFDRDVDHAPDETEGLSGVWKLNQVLIRLTTKSQTLTAYESSEVENTNTFTGPLPASACTPFLKANMGDKPPSGDFSLDNYYALFEPPLLDDPTSAKIMRAMTSVLGDVVAMSQPSVGWDLVAGGYPDDLESAVWVGWG